ncbi:YkvA family protein [Anaerosolibacter carboniphilus]|nr:YkvA family protein [Anaerosolibacter carboniphilus]
MKLFDDLKIQAEKIKKDLSILYLAYRKPEVPWYAKVFIALIVGYALSPVDLIPDFVPILGYLDDLILIPIGITLAIKLIPAEVIESCRLEAEDLFKDGKPKSWKAGAIIILVWLLVAVFVIHKFTR